MYKLCQRGYTSIVIEKRHVATRLVALKKTTSGGDSHPIADGLGKIRDRPSSTPPHFQNKVIYFSTVSGNS